MNLPGGKGGTPSLMHSFTLLPDAFGLPPRMPLSALPLYYISGSATVHREFFNEPRVVEGMPEFYVSWVMMMMMMMSIIVYWCISGESKLIADMLSNPHLSRIVCNLDNSRKPDVDIEAAMHEPIFTEFVDECLRIVEPSPGGVPLLSELDD